jgi:predicted phosphodiesterase
VLNKIDDLRVDKILCLGDIVGYNANPNEVIELLQKRSKKIIGVIGNHDVSVAGGIYADKFTPDFMSALTQAFMNLKFYEALEAIGWTIREINQKNAAYLVQDYYTVTILEGVSFVLMHGRPPIINKAATEIVSGYFYDHEIRENKPKVVEFLIKLEAQVLLTGHTHIPHFISLTPKGNRKFYAINPGSVGQPRNGFSGASFVTMELKNGSILEISHHSVKYDYFTTQEKIKEAKLPHTLAERLEYGL